MRIRAGWSGALALGLVVVGGCAGGDSTGEGSGAASEPEAVEGSEASPEATPELSASELMSRIEAGDLPPAFADRSIHVVTSCQAGPMAARAAAAFSKLGFASVSYVSGGTQAWVDAGLPTVR